MLNDFEANGYGVTALDEKHLVVLNDVLSTEKVRVSSLERKPVADIVLCCASLHPIVRYLEAEFRQNLRMQQRCRARRLCSGLEQGWGRRSCSGTRSRVATRCGRARGPTLGSLPAAGSSEPCRQGWSPWCTHISRGRAVRRLRRKTALQLYRCAVLMGRIALSELPAHVGLGVGLLSVHPLLCSCRHMWRGKRATVRWST